MTLHQLASGQGWGVCDIVCTAGPHDRSFEEQHQSTCIAVVSEGTFQYRNTYGAALLAPGSLLLGNAGNCFECGHEHAAGDRCLSFHFTAEYLEGIAAAVPGARSFAFPCSHLPPLLSLMPLVARIEAARDEKDGAELEELAVTLAGVVAATLVEPKRQARPPSRRDERRVTEAVRRIETDADQPLSLAELARDAATSPYHFLRIFRQIVGMTPHQFILRIRLHRAAVRLRRSRALVSAIAFDAGFNDLSTFNHRFRRIMGMSPTAYRAGG